MEAEDVLEGKAGDPFELSFAAESVKQLEECVFSLATHGIVHVAGVQRCVTVDRREISAPHDRNFGVQTANLAATFYCGGHLGTRHH